MEEPPIPVYYAERGEPHDTIMTQRAIGWLIPGLTLILLGSLMPGDWYVPVRLVDMPLPPFSGLTLLRSVLVLAGLCVILLVATGWRFVRLGPRHLPDVPTSPPGELSTATMLRWLAGITLLAGGLRFYDIGSDLWFDEIASLETYRSLTGIEIWISYLAANNHLLSTLLVKLSTASLGESEAAIRIWAVVFGVATIPVLYATCRLVASQRVSLGAALLLAVSYHHIFFSQNARGYTAYVFFAVLSILFFLRALRQDLPWAWTAYVAVTLLGLASLLLMAFVFATEILLGGWAIVQVQRRRDDPWPLAGRLTLVFLAVGLASVHLYAPVIPQLYAYLRTEYTSASMGYSLASREFYDALVTGLVGRASPWQAVPALVGASVTIAGAWSVAARNWLVLAAFAGPAALQVAFQLAGGLAVYPRTQTLCLPALLLVLVAGIDVIARWAVGRLGRTEPLGARVWLGAIALACVASAVPLRGYYAYPKQDYRGALHYVESARGAGCGPSPVEKRWHNLPASS